MVISIIYTINRDNRFNSDIILISIDTLKICFDKIVKSYKNSKISFGPFPKISKYIIKYTV